MNMCQKVNSIIELIYESALGNYDWKDTLQKCAKLIDVAAVVVVPFDPNLKDMLLTSLNKPEHDASSYDYYHRTDPYCKIDPYNISFKYKKNIVGDFPDNHLLVGDEIKKSAFYNEFLKKYNWGRVNVFVDQDIFTSGIKISTQRYDGQRSETNNEKYIRNIISRHICRSLSFSSIYTSLILENTCKIHNDANFGIALLNRSGKILMMNPIFKSLIGNALTYEGGELSSTNQKNKHQITKILNKVSHMQDTVQASEFAVINNTDGQKILLKAMRISLTEINNPLLNNNDFIVLLTKSLEPVLPDISDIMQALGLTRSEARLASIVGAGHPPRQAAKIMGISEQYARTMLKEIFYKLNVNSQSQLAALIGNISSFGRFSS
ncbi:helix-turn-helix transcriptional regulator [Novacetimonas pomaceti]|nr:helix-turn-helix transcriptional regulator [Novacetimonas pomaceti]